MPTTPLRTQSISENLDVGEKTTWWRAFHTAPYTSYAAAKANSVFCVEPAGDTVLRASLYQDILFGCIPVIFRNDSAYLDMLAFSSTVPSWLKSPSQ